MIDCKFTAMCVLAAQLVSMSFFFLLFIMLSISGRVRCLFYFLDEITVHSAVGNFPDHIILIKKAAKTLLIFLV